MVIGVVAGLQVSRLVPPPPVFSERLGRITQFQSYANNYFASLRSFSYQVSRAVAAGRIPVVVLGDSTFRGAAATGGNVWTVRLQHELDAVNPALQVINFSQNGGNLIAPYLYYYLQRRFPEAIFVVQWHYHHRTLQRHPFMLWLSSEIILRDGRDNPAVKLGLEQSPIDTADEWWSVVMAALNIAAPYLDLGNHLRYWALGDLSLSPHRNPVIVPVGKAEDTDRDITAFVPPPTEAPNTAMRNMYRTMMGELRKTATQSPEALRRFFDELYPPRYRERLLLVTVDFNPYYAPTGDAEAMAERKRDWNLLGEGMATIAGLHWQPVMAGADGLVPNDFADLGHLNINGQAHLAKAVGAALAAMPAAQPRRAHAEAAR